MQKGESQISQKENKIFVYAQEAVMHIKGANRNI